MLSLIIGTLNEFLVITGEYMNQKTASAPAAENKMGTMPIGRLLFNMSLPMMVSMLVQALYNIVDSIFVAKLSENALTAVSLAFPLQMLLIAVAVDENVIRIRFMEYVITEPIDCMIIDGIPIA